MDILIVDDEESIARLFRQRFRKEIREGKINFHFAFNGDHALEIFRSSNAEVVMILSDINMPGMSGLELLEQIRSTDKNIPIYMISAYDNDEYSKKSSDLGANGFIPKPLNFESLRDLLRMES